MMEKMVQEVLVVSQVLQVKMVKTEPEVFVVILVQPVLLVLMVKMEPEEQEDSQVLKELPEKMD